MQPQLPPELIPHQVDDPYFVGRFLGLRNVAQQRRQPSGALSMTKNVDVDDEGGIVSRLGYVKVADFTDITAAFTPAHQQFSYVVAAGELYRVGTDLSQFALGTVSSAMTHWAEAGDKVFLSTGYVVEGDTLNSWRVAPPSPLTAHIGAGNLPAGQYQLTSTYLTADGRESATSSVEVLLIPEGGSISIENAAGRNIYVSEANGEVLYYVGTGVNVIDSTVYLSVPLDPALLLNNALPDNIGPIAYYDTSMFYSVYDPPTMSSVVGWSKSFRWHVFDVSDDYFVLPGEVRLLVATDKFLAVATDKKIYGYDGESLTELANYGVPHGHLAAKDAYENTFIWTNRGVCVLDPFTNMTLDKVSLPPGAVDSVAVIEQQGIEKFIILTDEKGLANNAVF